ncbi:MAG: peptide chain release factor N(5)-glutamine methyltransferase [Myxococcota bacterium]
MSERVWTPLELVRWTTDYFGRSGIPSPRLDAELLLAHVLELERLDLYLHFDRVVRPAEREAYRALVRRRASERVPIAYLTGRREFWSLPLRVTPDVLVPRPETETLVRAVIELAPGRIAEVGTGSGAIAAALATELPDLEVVATDISKAALEVARANLERLGLGERVSLRLGDGLAPLGTETFDAIVSNPPYIPSGQIEGLAPELSHEPRGSLDGGCDGLALIARLVSGGPLRLSPGGSLVLEIGEGQAPSVQQQLEAAGALWVRVRDDLAGIPRVVVARFGEAG